MGNIDIVHMPVGHLVGDLGEPPLDQRTMLGLLERDHQVHVVEISQ